MTPENVLILKDRVAAVALYPYHSETRGIITTWFCSACDEALKENEVGKFCDSCWAKLTEGLE